MRWRKSPRPRSEDGWWMVHTTVPHRRFWSCVTWQWKWGGRAPVNWDHHLSKKTSASATWTAAISFLWLYDHCHILQPSKETTQEASYEDQNDEYPWTIDKNYLFIYNIIYIYIYYTYILYICIYRYEISLHDMSFMSILYVWIYGFLWKWGPLFIEVGELRSRDPRQPLSAKSFTIRMTSRLHPPWKSQDFELFLFRISEVYPAW